MNWNIRFHRQIISQILDLSCVKTRDHREFFNHFLVCECLNFILLHSWKSSWCRLLSLYFKKHKISCKISCKKEKGIQLIILKCIKNEGQNSKDSVYLYFEQKAGAYLWIQLTEIINPEEINRMVFHSK